MVCLGEIRKDGIHDGAESSDVIVTAVVELKPGATFDETALRSHVREQLAAYKTPKRVFAIESMLRAPNGQADYESVAAYARERT